MQSFRGKKVFVTGGSSGIGKAIAIDLARRGASVCISARGEQRLESALDDIKAAKRGRDEQVFAAIPLDVADEAMVKKAAPDVLQRLGGLDMLVNNAGISRVGELCDAKPEDYRETMAVNYFGTVWTTLAFLPHFQQQRSGVVCGVSSLLGLMGLYGYSAYAGSKFALTGFFDCLRQDLLKYGVQVSVLFPADTDTPQLHEENKMKPAATKAIAGNAGIASPEFVANAFLDGVLAGKYQIIPGLESKFVVWANNKIPQVMRWYITRDLRRHWQRASEPGAAPAV